MTRLTPITPAALHEGMAAGRYTLIDIRERDEFARSRIEGAVNQPLSEWEDAHLSLAPDRDVVFTCRSGMRTEAACARLSARVAGEALLLSGGVEAWRRAGLPLAEDAGAPLELMRQVQIAAGSLVLLGVLLGWLVAPLWFGLSAFVGAGLVFAGVSGFCGMARLLLLAPWNRRALG
ncbi:MAG: rhodanese-like domain-containing protein [Sphingopyxis sp.]|uniref:rhodanese-like domain-containing protein n=1 Tax=Sphingopyxis sp. TaxID=1908224 RepID=UPI002ABCF537|nr:rhodanese-like domain-containing protein [Sphingopyxis sp.]MDZ3832937.1 rhodanese-like domain-containing protein [Sphingopyxis sp.]